MRCVDCINKYTYNDWAFGEVQSCDGCNDFSFLNLVKEETFGCEMGIKFR